MIQIARVDYPNLPPELRRLLIERAQGVGRVHGRIEISPTDVDADDGTSRRGLSAHVHGDAAQDPRVVLLDAALAEHVLAAVTQLLAGSDPAVRAEQAGSPWAWSVELDWGGTVTHLEVHGVPSDEALHGMLELAAQLLNDTTGGAGA